MARKLPINKIIWKNCYEDSWQDLIVPEAFSHPAKMARGLLRHIFDHIKLNKWKADIIIDPFGGIGSTGILGAYSNYQVVCIELEPKFVKLAEQNFALHKNAWQKLGNPYPVIIQGDSRRLCEIVEKADIIVSSPPFTQQFPAHDKQENYKGFNHVGSIKNQATGYRYGENTPGNLGAMKSGNIADVIISSPPYAESLKGDGTQSETAAESRAKRRTPGGSLGQSQRTQGYGSKENLGNLKSGDVDLVISSPPYAESGGTPSLGSVNKDNWGAEGKDICGRRGLTARYGNTKGNLGNLKAGDVDVIVSSPPYEKAHNAQESPGGICDSNRKDLKKWVWTQGTQGNSQGQLGQEQGETFWSAAKIIVQQCYQILRLGGHAIWVTKDFVRKGKRVTFSDDWQRLCESVGFTAVCRHKAMLVKEEIHQSLFGHKIVKKTERKSFFRRLAESKGSPRIDHEDVLCMRK